ncbi:MAG: cobalt-precorrin-5B (C(1))-methyltransferase CbiD [Faecousia sp.]
MEEFIQKDGKRLRLGYTTGSCAAAAAKAAAWMLLTGRRKERITLTTPKGIELDLAVLDIRFDRNFVSCAIEKDGGDDPDITKGAHITAAVSRSCQPGIVIDGGEGVGRVTKPGLDQPVGAAAINSIPRQMILENVGEICECLDYRGGLSVEISVPGGESLAQKTFNPRLGIVGGISILGTTGIVEPMSEKALVDTIRVELRQRKEGGADFALLTPGNYGTDFIRMGLSADPALAVQVSNFLGDALDIGKELSFHGILLVGHIGKLAKVAGGMLNTHSKFGDCRMEIIAAHAGACGLPAEKIEEILNCAVCDDALRILKEAGFLGPAMQRLTERIVFHLRHRGDPMEVGVLIFSKTYGIVGQTNNAMELLKRIAEG